MHIAVAHIKADPDTLGSAYAYSILKGIPYFVPDKANPATAMLLQVYISKKPLFPKDINGTYHLHLLDFHSSASLHEVLKTMPIDTIIDHHIEGDLSALHMVIDPIGATSTLVGEMFADMPHDVALFIGFGICDDTAGGILHATDRDIAMLKTIKGITGKDASWFMDKLKEAYIEGFTPDFDTRVYNIGGYIITIGQFRAPGVRSSEKISREVSHYVYSLEGDMALYILSDPEVGKSLIIGKVDTPELAPLLGRLSGTHPLLSRKVDVLPTIRQYIEKELS